MSEYFTNTGGEPLISRERFEELGIALSRADHPHSDPGDGRTECPTCGKWVWIVTHSCKGVRVAGTHPTESCRHCGHSIERKAGGGWWHIRGTAFGSEGVPFHHAEPTDSEPDVVPWNDTESPIS